MNTTSLMTLPDVCREGRIGRSYLYQLIGKGDLAAVKAGRRTLVRRADFEEWLAKLPAYEPAAPVRPR